MEKFKMTDRRRRRSGASAKEDVDRDERQQAAEELINDNGPKRRHKDEEKRTLLEELAEYEPRTAYDWTRLALLSALNEWLLSAFNWWGDVGGHSGLARETGKDFQEMASVAFADFLKKHKQPVGFKAALEASMTSRSKVKRARVNKKSAG
jgi:hypothetical protein